MIFANPLAQRLIVPALVLSCTASISAGAQRGAPNCGVDTGILTANRVGALRLHMHADSVRMVCHVVRDTMEDGEGDPYRVLVIAVDNDTLRPNVDRGVVRTVDVPSPRFFTADSLRVGVTLARLRAYPGMKADIGEGDYVLYDESDPRVCGFTFRVEIGHRDYAALPRGLMETFPDSVLKLRVDEIFVRGCIHAGG